MDPLSTDRVCCSRDCWFISYVFIILKASHDLVWVILKGDLGPSELENKPGCILGRLLAAHTRMLWDLCIFCLSEFQFWLRQTALLHARWHSNPRLSVRVGRALNFESESVVHNLIPHLDNLAYTVANIKFSTS